MEHQNEHIPGVPGEEGVVRGGAHSDQTDYVLTPKERRRLALEEVNTCTHNSEMPCSHACS